MSVPGPVFFKTQIDKFVENVWYVKALKAMTEEMKHESGED